MQAKLLTATSMLTGKVALSYPNLLTPSQSPVSKGKYGCNLFCLDEETKAMISQICNAAYKEALQTKWGGKAPKSIEPRVRDLEEDEAAPEGAIGTILCSNGNKPITVISAAKDRITDPACPDIYGGAYARAQLRAYAWEFAGKKGVSLSVDAVQLLGGGEPLGGGVNLDAFDDESEGLTATGATGKEPDLTSDLPF